VDRCQERKEHGYHAEQAGQGNNLKRLGKMGRRRLEYVLLKKSGRGICVKTIPLFGGVIQVGVPESQHLVKAFDPAP